MAAGSPPKKLSKEYGVCSGMIHGIVNGDNWKES